jgi:MFS family permease
MLWKPLRLIMIIPAIGAALLITWQRRHRKSELPHNIAVVFWINAHRMITEFYSKDDSLRYYAAITFSMGIIVIAYIISGIFREVFQKGKDLCIKNAPNWGVAYFVAASFCFLVLYSNKYFPFDFSALKTQRSANQRASFRACSLATPSYSIL